MHVQLVNVTSAHSQSVLKQILLPKMKKQQRSACPFPENSLPHSTFGFEKRGNDVRAFYHLQEEGLGEVVEVAGSKGTLSVSRCRISKHLHVDQDVEKMRMIMSLCLHGCKCAIVLYHTHISWSYSNLSLPRHVFLLLRKTKLSFKEAVEVQHNTGSV